MTIKDAKPRTRTRVLRNFSSLMAVKGLNLIVPVMALPYLLRTVGLQNYGQVAFATAIATFAGSIISYGFSVTGVQAVASAREDAPLLAKTFWRNFLANIMIAIIVIVIHTTVILSLPFLRDMWLLHTGAILLAAGNALVPHWLFLGVERSYFAAITTFVVRSSYLALLIIFVRAPDDYILINVLGAVTAWLNVALALAIAIAIFKLKPLGIAVLDIIETIRGGFSSFLLQWTPNLYNSASIMLLGFYVSPATLGAFSAANTVVTLAASLGQLLANAFLPILATSFNGHKISSRLLLLTGLIVTVAIMLSASTGTRFLTNTGHEIISYNIYLLAASIPFMFGYYAFGYNYVALIDSHQQASYAVLLISTAALLISLLIVPTFASAGVAAVLFLARGGMFAVAYAIYRKHRSSI